MTIAAANREDDRFFIQQAFRQHGSGWLLQALSSGQELFELLADSVVLPSLILLDLNMPLMNGFEVLQRLGAHGPCGAVPVVILSTSEAVSDRQLALGLGARGFMTKPSTLTEFAPIVGELERRWLRKR